MSRRFALALGIGCAAACSNGGGSDASSDASTSGSTVGTESTGSATTELSADASTSESSASASTTDTSAESTGGDCPNAGEVSVVELVSGDAIGSVAAGDLDGDGRLDLAVALASGGVASYLSSVCGWPTLGATALTDRVVTGVATANLVDGGGLEVVAFDEGRTLSALAGDTLATEFDAAIDDLASAGAVVAAHLDTDGDHDVAAFDATNGTLVRVENTGSAWVVHVVVALPPGIARVGAGPLSGNARDELLFLGAGLVEVISVADFDFSDVQPLSGAVHSAAAFGAFPTDAAMIGAGATIELWGGGTEPIAMQSSSPVAAEVVDVAPLDRGDGPSAVALLSDGTLQIVDAALTPVDAATIPGAARVVAGDVDGDGRDDVVAVASDGSAFVWRTPP